MFISHYTMKVLLKVAREAPPLREEILEVFKLAYEIFEIIHLKKKAIEYSKIINKLNT